MYWKFFSLREDPFGLTPDSRFLYLTEAHSEVLSTLREGIEAHRGFVALTSQPGVGKTSLLHALREQVADQAVTAFLFQTGLEPLAILRMLWKELGLDASQTDPVKMHQQFEEGLARVAAMGKQFVLFIDEAQGLSPAALETIRLLSNFETGRKKMVEIVLAGHPELEQLLARPGLEHIRQRVSVFCRLKPLTRAESVQYVQHRLRVAGASGPPIFTDEALQVLALLGKGIARTLNIYAFQAMMKASKRAMFTVDEALVREAIHQFEGWSLAASEASRGLNIPGVGKPVPVTPTVSAAHLSTKQAEEDDFFTAPKDPALQELLNSLRVDKKKEYVDDNLVLAEAPRPLVPSSAPRQPLKIMPGFASAAAPAPALALDLGAETQPAAAVTVPELAVIPIPEANAGEPLAAEPEKNTVAPAALPTQAPAAARPAKKPSAKQLLAFMTAALVVLMLAVSVWMVARGLRSRRSDAATAIPSPALPSAAAIVPAAQPSSTQQQSATTTSNASTLKSTPPMQAPPAAAPSEKGQRRPTAPESAAEIAAGVTRRIEVTADASAPALPDTAIGSPSIPSLGSALHTPASDAVKLQAFATPPVPTEQPRPEYPLIAKQLRLSGEVVLKVQVNRRGRATSVQVVSGHPVLAAAAQNAVKNFWRFQPATQNGETVEGEAEVRVVYRQGGN